MKIFEIKIYIYKSKMSYNTNSPDEELNLEIKANSINEAAIEINKLSTGIYKDYKISTIIKEL